MDNIICVVGPTASGKTALAVELAKATNGEVVSCDSMQIYRRLNIGTAKPTVEEMQGIPHHMIDICEPDEDFSVGRYVEMATPIVEDILRRGKTAVIAGGTGLYVDNLIKGGEFAPTPSTGCRERLEERLLLGVWYPHDERRAAGNLEPFFVLCHHGAVEEWPGLQDEGRPGLRGDVPSRMSSEPAVLFCRHALNPAELLICRNGGELRVGNADERGVVLLHLLRDPLPYPLLCLVQVFRHVSPTDGSCCRSRTCRPSAGA